MPPDVVVSGKPNNDGTMDIELKLTNNDPEVAKIGKKTTLMFTMDPSDKLVDLVEEMREQISDELSGPLAIDAVANEISREVSGMKTSGVGFRSAHS
jgi:hypothetical protein